MTPNPCATTATAQPLWVPNTHSRCWEGAPGKASKPLLSYLSPVPHHHPQRPSQRLPVPAWACLWDGLSPPWSSGPVARRSRGPPHHRGSSEPCLGLCFSTVAWGRGEEPAPARPLPLQGVTQACIPAPARPTTVLETQNFPKKDLWLVKHFHSGR